MATYPQNMLGPEWAGARHGDDGRPEGPISYPGRIIVRGDGSAVGTRVFVLAEEGREIEIAALSVELSINHDGRNVPMVKIVADHPRLQLVTPELKKP